MEIFGLVSAFVLILIMYKLYLVALHRITQWFIDTTPPDRKRAKNETTAHSFVPYSDEVQIYIAAEAIGSPEKIQQRQRTISFLEECLAMEEPAQADD